MPVNVLLCEGGPGSPDVRVLGKLLAGLCEVKPEGGKYGMGQKIIAKRDAIGNVVSGLLDGDFLESWVSPTGCPRNWTSGNGISFGWRWERKEVENYLIDPDIVAKALGPQAPNHSLYILALHQARDQIAYYQAARTSLSVNRKRFDDLPSCFGPERGKEKHLFPNQLCTTSCEEGIKKTVINHQNVQIVELDEVLTSYKNYIPEFIKNGTRHKEYLYAFAGKDLFWAMEVWFKQNNFHGAWAFREKVLIGIQQTTEDISSWVPEWEKLLQMIKG